LESFVVRLVDVRHLNEKYSTSWDWGRKRGVENLEVVGWFRFKWVRLMRVLAGG